MYKLADDKPKRLVEGQRSALERGGEDGRIGESAYGSEGVKVKESANWSLTFVIACCVSKFDKIWSAEGFGKTVVTVEDCKLKGRSGSWTNGICDLDSNRGEGSNVDNRDSILQNFLIRSSRSRIICWFDELLSVLTI